MRASFDKEKALQALVYIAGKAPQPDYIHIVKILYFAEKGHLQQYGRMICSDDYKRLQWGPIPTRSYDLLKEVEGRGNSHFLDMNPDLIREAKRFLATEKKAGEIYFRQLRKPDATVFSKSDLKCLDEAIKKYGTTTFAELTNKSHDEVWKLSQSFDISLEEIIATLPNRDELLEYVNGSD